MTRPYRTVWLLGASSGIGAELVPGLLERADALVVSARHQDRLEAVRDRQHTSHDRIHILPVDVTDVASMGRTAETIEERIGPLDLVFYNVGDYAPAGIDNLDPALFQRLMNINYLGAVNCLAAVVPFLRTRQHGKIVINASLAGYLGLPHAAAYGPTKAALINLTECLYAELAREGIALRIINHGFVRTRLTEKNNFTMPFLVDAATAASRILQQLDSNRFETVFPLRFAWLMKCLRLLPYPVFFSLTRRLV